MAIVKQNDMSVHPVLPTCELCLFGDIEALLHSLSLSAVEAADGWYAWPREEVFSLVRARERVRVRGVKRGVET